MQDKRPICAIATAPGQGAIGVVRVSAPEPDIITALAADILGPERRLVARKAAYGPFLAADAQPIDYGLALWFPAPHSYTGEHILELQGHGGPVVQQILLRRVLQVGAAFGIRLAEPGEFTERAFLNDKLDLVQAEAVADLIEASTEQAARSATRSLQGVFSRQIDDSCSPCACWSRPPSTSPKRRSISCRKPTLPGASRASTTPCGVSSTPPRAAPACARA